MLRGRRSVGRLGVAVLVSLVVLGACGGNDNKKNKAEGGSTNGKKTVALGFVGPLTGDSANLGVNIRDGAKVAIDQWNKKGGPTTDHLKEVDTQGDPAQAPAHTGQSIPT